VQGAALDAPADDDYDEDEIGARPGSCVKSLAGAD
jgi:hypothetical protein